MNFLNDYVLFFIKQYTIYPKYFYILFGRILYAYTYIYNLIKLKFNNFQQKSHIKYSIIMFFILHIIFKIYVTSQRDLGKKNG